MKYVICSYLCKENPYRFTQKNTLRCSYGHMGHLHKLRNETHILFLFLKFLLWATTMHVPRISFDFQRTLQDIYNWKVQAQRLTFLLMFFPLAFILQTQKWFLVAKDSYKKRLKSKIWSPYEWGSNDVSRNVRNLRNPFQKTFGNRKPPYSAKSNSVAPFHVIVTNFNRLFWQNNRLFFKETWKRFWEWFVLAFWIKPQPSLAKNTILRSKNNFKIRLAFWKLVHSFYKIMNFLLNRFVVFTKARINTLVIRVWINHFQSFKISFWIVQLFFQGLDTIFQPGV